MADLIVTAYPNSGISGAQVAISAYTRTTTVKVGAGGFEFQRVQLPGGLPIVEFELSVETLSGRAHVYAENIPADAHVHVIGVSDVFFMGLIDHNRRALIHHEFAPRLAPRCQLRCTPKSRPVQGPGCIVCRDGGLSFRVCC